MKRQTFNTKSRLLLSAITILLLGLYTPEAMATAPKQALKGALPIPGTSQTNNFLTLSQHGTVLENDNATLVWQDDGNLVLIYCNLEVIWETKSSGKGKLLVFDNNSGRLEVQDQSGNTIWTTNKDGGAKLELQDNRNVAVLDGSNKTLWQSNSGFPDLSSSSVQTLAFKSHDDLTYDFMVPKSTTYKYVYIHAEGGDGGNRQVKEIDGSTRFTVKGGSGASIAGIFEIGTGTNQIPPGSSVRFIIGQKGHNRIGQTGAGSTGGGGTGVLFKKPNDNEWHLLIVAGGGGGAYSDCCTNKREGRSGEITENGGDGGANSGSGGTNGGAGGGHGLNFQGTPGHGINCWEGADHDRTALPTGERDEPYEYLEGDNRIGGSGFRLAGFGDASGGGGGGYSGGGCGATYREGGGGGSYLNGDMAKDSYKVKHPSTNDTQDGFVRYQLTNSSQISKQIKFAYNTGKCIDDYGSSTSNGTNIQTYNCHSNANQWWYFNPDDRAIRSKLNANKCLDLDHSDTNNGTNIQLWDCNGTSAQKWVYNGIHKTIHSGVNSDKCLDAKGGVANKDQNVTIQLWDCKYDAVSAQKWAIEGATTISDLTKIKHIVPVLATGFAVHSHTGAESGSNIQLWTKDNINTAEQWYFDGLAIKMKNNQNLCIDLSQGNTNNGNNIQLYNCNGTNAQKWIYDGMSQVIRSVINPDKCMQIEYNTDGVYGKRSNVQIHDCNGSEPQLFTIQE